MLRNLSTGIDASATGESLNSGDPAVHPAARHRPELSTLECAAVLGATALQKPAVAASVNTESE